MAGVTSVTAAFGVRGVCALRSARSNSRCTGLGVSVESAAWLSAWTDRTKVATVAGR